MRAGDIPTQFVLGRMGSPHGFLPRIGTMNRRTGSATVPAAGSDGVSPPVPIAERDACATRFLGRPCAVLLGLMLSLVAARGQLSFSDQNSVHSLSGQFLVTSVPDPAPLYRNLTPVNTNVVQLQTALVAVAAERFKISLWRQLGLPANASWSGKIHLRLHPAASPDETVAIASTPFLNRWNYGVDLPDQLWKARFARALSGVLLLEIANRAVRPDGRSAEIPAWLVDGLAQHVLAAEGNKVLLSAPRKADEQLAVSRSNQTDRGFDPLAGARKILLNAPALTFDQLSWPTEGQREGADGGVYHASAQLFQSELLGLKNGAEKMRALLAGLPEHLNWQTAFFQAFGDDFKHPVDVEKWWALRVVNFASRASGPRWTTGISLVRLQGLLSVPVEFRNASNALPAHAEISLQSALRSLSPEQRELVLRTKARDLALAELRLAPPFGGLADGYRVALADYLGDTPQPSQPSAANKHGTPVNRPSLADTLKKLDDLDRRRRNAETRSVIPLPGSGAGTP